MCPTLTAIPPPMLRLFPGLRQTHEPVLIQALQPEPGIGGLDKGVFRGLSGAADVERHICPSKSSSDSLRFCQKIHTIS